MEKSETLSVHEKRNRFSLDQVSRDMDRPRRFGLSLLLRVRIYDGDPAKPKIRFSIPMPLVLCFSFPLDILACVLLHMTSIILPFIIKGSKSREKASYIVKMMSLLQAMSRRFFLTQFVYGFMRHGGGLGARAIDGDSGVVIHG